MANRHAHLPRVQAPVHMQNGVPGVHHKRRPQDMTKMTQNTLNYSKKLTSKQTNKENWHKVQNTQNYEFSTKTDNFYMEMLLVCWLSQ